jgi:hypothetical protein
MNFNIDIYCLLISENITDQKHDTSINDQTDISLIPMSKGLDGPSGGIQLQSVPQKCVASTSPFITLVSVDSIHVDVVCNWAAVDEKLVVEILIKRLKE